MRINYSLVVVEIALVLVFCPVVDLYFERANQL